MKFKRVSKRVLSPKFMKTWKRGKKMLMPMQFMRPWGMWYRLIAGVTEVLAPWNK